MPQKSTQKNDQVLEDLEEKGSCERCGKELPMDQLNNILCASKMRRSNSRKNTVSSVATIETTNTVIARNEIICNDCFVSEQFRTNMVILEINGTKCFDLPQQLVDNLNKQVGGNPCIAVRWIAIATIMKISLEHGKNFMGEKYDLARKSMDAMGFDSDELIAYEQLTMIVDQFMIPDQFTNN